MLLQLLPLTEYTDNPAAPDRLTDDAAAPEDESNWKSTATSAAKLFLRTAERASDAFPPLKSAAAGLCAILDSCEVCPPSFARCPVLTILAANDGQQKNDRIPGIPG